VRAVEKEREREFHLYSGIGLDIEIFHLTSTALTEVRAWSFKSCGALQKIGRLRIYGHGGNSNQRLGLFLFRRGLSQRAL